MHIKKIKDFASFDRFDFCIEDRDGVSYLCGEYLITPTEKETIKAAILDSKNQFENFDPAPSIARLDEELSKIEE